MKSLFILLSLCCFEIANVVSANSAVSLSRVEIAIDGNFDFPDSSSNDHRSAPSIPPFSAFLNDDHSIDMEFYQAIGEIEIIISQNGNVVYSSIEQITCSFLKNLPLPQGLSGSCLLEIKGNNGGCIWGNFNVD